MPPLEEMVVVEEVNVVLLVHSRFWDAFAIAFSEIH